VGEVLAQLLQVFRAVLGGIVGGGDEHGTIP
jgi:hypothetical protein